jgi:hypothetical protein
MGTRYYVSYTLMSGPQNDLNLNGVRTYASFDTEDLADQAVAKLQTKDAQLRLLEQLRREPELKDTDLRISEIHTREVED